MKKIIISIYSFIYQLCWNKDSMVIKRLNYEISAWNRLFHVHRLRRNGKAIAE